MEKITLRNPENQEAAMESVRLIQREIEKIVSVDIKEFTYQAFAEVDEHFWTAPASSSGKYHPPEDNGEGGLVRHVVKGVVVVEQFGRRAKFTPREIDMGISAFLLHDTCKNGVVWTSSNTDYTHGLIAAKWLEKFDLADAMAKEQILSAVRYHMAPWCYAVSPYEERSYTKQEMNQNLDELTRAMYPTRVEQAVREADYWSSRSSMSFFPGVAVEIRHDGPVELEN
jgi:hypothetical protein